jgi:hypothetical protein
MIRAHISFACACTLFFLFGLIQFKKEGAEREGREEKDLND